jgi:hypothetical protein
VVNVNYYRNNVIPVAVGQNGGSDQIGLQNSPLFSVIEQRGNLQVQFGNLQKNSFKISLPNLSFDKVLFVIKAFNAETCYSFLCQIIVPGLEKPDIIFPFHNFW